MATTVQTHPLRSIRSSATVQEAARLMADYSIAALGVLDKDRQFTGIVTERDLSWFVAQGKDPVETTVEDITNDFPVVVEGPVDDSAALDRMRKARVRHLIVHEGDDLRIVSMRDLVLKAPEDKPSEYPRACDVMTAPAIACRDEAFFEEVAEILAARYLRDAGGRSCRQGRRGDLGTRSCLRPRGPDGSPRTPTPQRASPTRGRGAAAQRPPSKRHQ